MAFHSHDRPSPEGTDFGNNTRLGFEMDAEIHCSNSETGMLLDGDTHFTVEQQRRVFNKLTRRVVLLSTGIVFVFCMDRGNVGLAANDLCKDLNLTHSKYGIAIGLFCIGSVSSQVASNVMLRHFGAPVWLSFIVLAWGCVATASAFIQNVWQFYVSRILLGITEGGSIPGVLYYLSLFFPEAYIEEAYGSVQAAAYLAVPMSIPLAAGLLSTDGMFGSTGWRNLFFVEGLIPIVFSVVLFFTLPESVETVSFLEPEEKRWLMRQHKQREHVPLSHVFKEIMDISKILPFWSITVVFGIAIAYYVVLTNWITLIIHDGLNRHEEEEQDAETCGSKGSSVLAVVLTAIPYTLSGAVCFFIRTKTTRIHNRTVFTAIILIICALLLSSWVLTTKVSFVFGFLSLTAAIAISGVPNMFAGGIILTLLPSELRATGMALGNGTASIAAIILPLIVGVVIDAYGYGYAILVIASVMVMGAVFSFVVRDPLLDVKPLIVR